MKLTIPALALAAFAAVDAFRVDVSDVAPPADILGEHQELERTFKVYSEDALEKISVAIAGPVFIAHKTEHAVEPATPVPTSVEPSTETPTVTPEATTPEPTTAEPTDLVPEVDGSEEGSDEGLEEGSEDGLEEGSEDGSEESSSWGSGSGSASTDAIVFPDGAVSFHAASHKEKLVATVTISGNSSVLLDLVEIVPYKKDEADGFRLTYKNQDAVAEGYVLTQIQLVEKHELRHVKSEFASVVNVASSVLTKDTKKSIKVWTAGAGNVFISEEGNIEAKNVDLDVAGSGSIQFVAASLKLDGELSASVAGSGSLAVHADTIKTNELKTNVAGEGSVYVITKNLTVEDFTSSVYGSAFASIIASESGRAETQKLTVAGSGAVYAGSVVATKSSVDVWGSGQAYVQVTEKLKTSASYSGQVYYVGAEPAEVKTSSWFFWRSPVKRAEADKAVTHDAVAAPPVYPAYVALELTAVHNENEPRVKLVDAARNVSFAMLTTHLAAVAHGPNGFLIFASVAGGLVAVAMAVQSYQQHRVRRHYTPLV